MLHPLESPLSPVAQTLTHPLRWFIALVFLMLLASCGGGGDAPLSSAKEITTFTFNKFNNTTLTTDIAGTVAGDTILVTLPFAVDRSALVASYTALGVSVKVGTRLQTSGVTSENFSKPVSYEVKAADGSLKYYTVTVVNAPVTAKDITRFAFTLAANNRLASSVEGTISGETIGVVLPQGVSRSALVATFSSTGASVGVGGAVQASGVTVLDFTNPVVYTATAADGSSKNYTVTVGNAATSAAQITSFAVLGINANITGTTIALTLPFGVPRSALVATFSSSGASVKVAGKEQVSGSTSNNFETALVYTVTAADGSTSNYTVVITNLLNNANDISAFSVAGVGGKIVGTVISVTLPFGVARTALVATFSSTGESVKVGTQLQTSGVTVNTFSSPLIYTVTAQDGSTKDYTVTVGNAANAAKEITAFSVLGVNSTIAGSAITITLPYGTDHAALVASFASTGVTVQVGGVAQTSGKSVNNFDAPVLYTVTAEDASAKTYTVTVSNVTSFEEVFVSPSGNDANPGTLDKPFKSLEAARNAVRGQIARGLPASGLTVWLRGGLYERSATLELNQLDSGTASSPVTWRACAGETARLVGARRLSPAWFTPVASSSPVWNRLDASAKGVALQVDLKAHGITDYGTLLPRGFGKSNNAALELFINGKAQPLGRWPDVDNNTAPYNHGFTTVTAVTSATGFTIGSNRLARWVNAPDAWVHGYFGAYWADDHIAVAALDIASQKITLASQPSFPTLAGQPWYAYNLLEEVTQPGEWYLDRTSGLLYVWPTAQFSTADVLVSTLSGPLFNLNGATGITLSGLRLESTRASLVTINDGSGNTLQQLVLKNAGTSAVVIDGGSKHRVAQSHIVDSGDGGVVVSGGDRLMLITSAHIVEGNEIEGFARFARTYHPAVKLSGVGQIVRHNLMHDSPHEAVEFTGNEHKIELNEIRDVLTATSDAGAIYTGRDWGARGNLIKNNFIHHIKSIFTEGYGVHGIYLDDAVSGIQVEGNVVYSVANSAIAHGGGRDVIIINNVLARNGTALVTDTRAYSSWVAGVSWATGGLLTALKTLNYQAEPWASRYPALAAIPNSWSVITANDGNPWLYPQGTMFSRNIGFANATWINNMAPTQWFQEIKNNIANEDPLFVDEARLDLTLKAGSPALVIPGFVPITFKSIGLRSEAMPPSAQ